MTFTVIEQNLMQTQLEGTQIPKGASVVWDTISWDKPACLLLSM